jgi:hypothetical protein
VGDCCCGNTEGTNEECERCRLIAENKRLRKRVIELESHIAMSIEMRESTQLRREETKRKRGVK